MHTYKAYTRKERDGSFGAYVERDDGMRVSYATLATISDAYRYAISMCKAANAKAQAVEASKKAAEKALDNFNYVGSKEHY